MAEIKKVLMRNLDWIIATLDKRISGKRNFVDGETFLYLGKALRLSVKRVRGKRGITVNRTPRLLVVQGPPDMSPDAIREALIRWFREEARVVLFGKVQAWAKAMRVKPNRVFIRDQRTRWGSCSSSGSLNLSFRLVMAPERMADYVVVHELAHLKFRNHSRDFWGFVESFIPDYKERQKWFRENGRMLRW